MAMEADATGSGKKKRKRNSPELQQYLIGLVSEAIKDACSQRGNAIQTSVECPPHKILKEHLVVGVSAVTRLLEKMVNQKRQIDQHATKHHSSKSTTDEKIIPSSSNYLPPAKPLIQTSNENKSNQNKMDTATDKTQPSSNCGLWSKERVSLIIVANDTNPKHISSHLSIMASKVGVAFKQIGSNNGDTSIQLGSVLGLRSVAALAVMRGNPALDGLRGTLMR